MTTVTLGVASRAAINRRVRAAFKGEKQGAYITFASVDVMFKVLTEKRRALIQALVGVGPVSIREAARRVGRDVKAVHGDIHELLNAGILEKSGDHVVFPYDALRIDATITEHLPDAAE